MEKTGLLRKILILLTRACFDPPKTFCSWLNLPLERMKQCAIESIVERQEAVWFGCDMGMNS